MAHKIDWPVTPPVRRPDAEPRSDNPIRRFREELRVTRKTFSHLLGTNVQTLRQWERLGPEVAMPRSAMLVAIIRCAKRNKYPLTINEIRQFVDERHYT